MRNKLFSKWRKFDGNFIRSIISFSSDTSKKALARIGRNLDDFSEMREQVRQIDHEKIFGLPDHLRKIGENTAAEVVEMFLSLNSK